jgi:hypothetical protein
MIASVKVQVGIQVVKVYSYNLYTRIKIGENVKGIRYTSYCNTGFSCHNSNLSFMATFGSNYYYGCWIFHI